MASDKSLVYYGVGTSEPPELVRRFAGADDLRVEVMKSAEAVHALMNRSFPACLILDASEDPDQMLELCSDIKNDAFTAIVPVILLASRDARELPAEGLAVGADEVLTEDLSEREQELRMQLLLRRAARDVSVHPTTRLPGTVQIERDLAERIEAGGGFGVCYADLDHFKEFNDRYGYNNGDRVIYLLSKILRDLVRGLAPGGFVGHIGGDDFIFNVPIEYLERCCDEVVTLFDELIPYQYTEEDRKAGYFLGKDRRGNVHRIPLMTLSIGVVTDQRSKFSHTAQVSELAAEMKTYAKSLMGSVYVVDRRGPEGSNRSTAVAGSELEAHVGTEKRAKQG